MDSTTFTAYTLDAQRAARLDRENELIRSQRARRDAMPAPGAAPTRAGLLARILHLPRRRAAHRVAAAH